MNKKDKILKYAIPIFSVICIFVLWSVVSFSVNSNLIFPSVKDTFTALFTVLSERTFYLSLLSTLIRSLLAFCISFLLALFLAVVSSKSKSAKRFISPFISVIRALPTIAIVLLLLFWISSKIAPIIVTSLIVIPTSYTNLLTSFSKVDNEVIQTCKFFNVSKKDIFFKVKLPSVLPDLLKIIGTGLTLNLKLMVAAEVLSSTPNCMGYLLNTFKVYYEISSMLALVLITVVIGLIIEMFFNVVSDMVDYENKFSKRK